MGREVAVDCVVLHDGKVLLLKRAHEEELGIDAEVKKLVGVFSDPDRDPRGLISVAFIMRPKSLDVRLNREASEYRWFPLDALPEKIGFDHTKILAQARALLKLQQP